MAFTLLVPQAQALGHQFKNREGHSECVEFVRQAAGLPETKRWKPGTRVLGSKAGDIPPNTAIATFADGRYPPDSDPLGHHAAIYLKHNEKAITVIDQWYDARTQRPHAVSLREIPFHPHHKLGDPKYRRSNDGTTFWTIEVRDADR